MFSIQSCALPEAALLKRYRDAGAYTDCYVTEIAGAISHAQYVAEFYCTAVFKCERLILKWFLSRPSTDTEAQQLAAGTLDRFAAWTVEQRAVDQMLLRDLYGRTRSWLMLESKVGAQGTRTRLYFGSAVVTEKTTKAGRRQMSLAFRALLGFHQLYSQILLHAARSRLMRR